MKTEVEKIVWSADISGNLTYVSPSVKGLLGYTVNEILQMKIEDFIAPDSVHLLKILLTRFPTLPAEKKTKPYVLETKQIHKDGSLVRLKDEISAVHNEFGEFTNFKGVSRCIERLPLMKKKANKEKTRFISLIAHDLKDPICANTKMLELLEEEYNSFSRSELFEIIREIHKNSKGVQKLLSNLLDWSTTQFNGFHPCPKLFKLHDLLENEFAMQKVFAGNKNISLKLEVDPHVHVFADSNMVGTIVRNLLNNAIKFTLKKGNIVLAAKTKGVQTFISIKDDGIGIKKELLKNLFILNKKKCREGTDQEKGTGLGLILCKELVELNYGSISIQSKHSCGSTFTIALPATKFANFQSAV